jgi:hypothetical protein
MTASVAGPGDILDANGTLVIAGAQFAAGAQSGSVVTSDANGNLSLQPGGGTPGAVLLDSFAGTDDQKMTSALAAVLAAGGGTVRLAARAHVFAGQWATAYSAGVATGVTIAGAGVAFNGAWGAPSAATVCTFTYAGGGAACIDMQHIGTIEISGIQFASANLGVPLFQTTNATPNIHDCVFSGGGSGVGCTTDAIVLGGTTTTVGAGDTAKYNAYQGLIYRNFFDGVRRCVLWNVATNSVHCFANTISTSCGTNLPFGAAFELAAISTRTINDVHIYDNCIEVSNYPFGIKASGYTLQCTFGPNGFYDPTSTHHLAAICLLPLSNYHHVASGYHSDAYPFVVDYGGTSKIENLHQSQHSVTHEPVLYTGSVVSGYFDVASTSLRGYDQSGDYAALQPANNAPGAGGYADVSVVSGNSTQMTDGATYLGSNWVVSATAAFTTTDAWLPITAPGIPSGTFIQFTATPTTAWPWQASYAYSLGDIARPTAANSHLYQVTTAGTSAGTQPTWPTGGGTVTDGSAVWTDLGTAATAAFTSNQATATGSGLTVRWGRLGQAQRTLVSFSRFHIITSSGGTPSTGADAGAGTSPTGISTAGSDHSFTVNITSGTSPASGQMFHSNLAQNSGTLRFGIVAGNAAAAALIAGGVMVTNPSNSVLVNFTNAPAASTAYIFSFVGMA